MAGDDAGEWPCTELPASWYWADFVTFFADHTDSQRKVPQKSYKQHGLIAVVDQGASKIGGFTNDLSMQSQAPLPAIVFGDHTRAVKYIDIPFAQGADGVRVLAARENVEPAFAYQALRCIKLPDKGYSRHFKFLKASRFPLAPLPEQRRIVAKIDSLTGRSKRARDHLDHIPRLVEKYRHAVLASAFSEGERAAWKNGKLEEFITDALIGLVRGKSEQSDVSGVPYIRMNHYDLNGHWNDNKLTFVEATPQEIERYELRRGDVLFNTRNSVELVGKVALWQDGRDRHVYNNNILRLRFNEKVVPRFATLWMMSEPFRAYLQTQKSATTSVCAIYQRSIMAAPFPLPSVAEQKAVVTKIDSAFAWIDRLTADATNARKLIDHLDQSVLAKAFRGELVPQDPADEPASALLDRIREERAAAPKAKRGRKKAA